MVAMTIKDIDDGLKKRLCIQAALHGCSLEEEVRAILRSALLTKELCNQDSLFKAIRSRVVPMGGIDIELPEREAIGDLPAL